MFGGSLGETGCVSYMFDRKGYIAIEREDLEIDEEEFMLEVIDAGAEELETSEELFEIYTEPEQFEEVIKAKNANMPNDNIDRAIKKASGSQDGKSYEEITYEGYGPSGVAVMVKCLTDNKNRTATSVRTAFSKIT
ncbi:hypothetical protein DT075_16535 [Bacillus licheniformis]|nr:hypothetical protein DT075_16535 [Bacillus licheniformis]